ncbi:UDP-galactose 4-epimerase [Anaerolinea thermolimosa]|uniref:UDP-glucose 4-epimerase GalE n=1 Tax=Anaerolinea thermolimosa TaxID=229919 RepID=UPI00078095BF|nr:UDP-glucose 4-epimerase GalE [Anaerolinea thermolimosa]GAP07786.1 UDP-galactose 4-epimerase [Anaerolinea thermolimosa]
MKVLVTGGAGYIGSTICSALEDSGHTPIILDNLVTGRVEFTRGRIFYQDDIANVAGLERIFQEHPDIVAAIHCAALIIVPESVEKPYEYYTENVAKSLVLFRTLNRLGCNRVVFSSSASVYDTVPGFMVREDSPLRPGSPYARTKYMMEMILQDFCHAYGMKGIALRYFNPIGADPKMRSGLQVRNPSLVLGKLVNTARGLQPAFEITGTTWPTRDGTGIRDYIHVWDLAEAHVMAVEQFDQVFERLGGGQSYVVINLGTGRGVTVRELVEAFERVYGKPINKVEKPPRPGDVAGAYANADTALRLLGWKAKLSIEQAIADALKWAEIRDRVLHYE